MRGKRGRGGGGGGVKRGAGEGWGSEVWVKGVCLGGFVSE